VVCAAQGLQHRPGAWVLHLSGGSAEQGRQILQVRYGGHALGGEHAAALQLPVLVLLQQHRPNQAGDRRVVGEDSVLRSVLDGPRVKKKRCIPVPICWWMRRPLIAAVADVAPRGPKSLSLK
jgi:hypothetical protein